MLEVRGAVGCALGGLAACVCGARDVVSLVALAPMARPVPVTPAQALEAKRLELAEFVAQFQDDPLGFVRACFPWDPDKLKAAEEGPDTWQTKALEDIGRQVRARRFDGSKAVRPIRIAVSSGHGIGKSTLQAWLVIWIMSTRPECRGTITANTATQLDTKTWAAIQHWAKRCITAEWFEINTARFYAKGQRESWFCAPQSCKEENSEAFAGQHAAGSTSFYVIDEGSAVPDKIYEVAEGGLTDGEPMIFVFGNCTRSKGMFYRICFGELRGQWAPIVVDSRDSRFTNKEQIAEWISLYGIDSDFVRVRVRGLPPAASDAQYISTALVAAAQSREAHAFEDDPLVCGLDVARGGGDNSVFRFRRGHDARSIPPVRLPGEKTRDSMRLVAAAVNILNKTFDTDAGPVKVAHLFIDGTGIGGPIYDRLVQLGYGARCTEVQFGGEAPEVTHGTKFANMRAWIWGACRDWLARGAIDNAPVLEQDLTGPGYGHDKSDRLVLESKESMKKRGLSSPDDGDALCLTFAAPVARVVKGDPAEDDDFSDYGPGADQSAGGWMA